MNNGLHGESHLLSSATRPLSLAGWRIVITRAEGQNNDLAERLRVLGAEPIAYPTIAFAPPANTSAFDAALDRLASGGYDWLVLTSANSVRAMLPAQLLTADSRREASRLYSRLPTTDCRIAAVGPATAAACRELLGREPGVIPETFVAEALAEALGEMHRQRVLLLNSDLARPTLARLLQDAGATVDRVVAYRTVAASGGPDLPTLLAQGEIDAITFASGSAVRFFVERVGPEALEYARRTVIACIGPVTAEAARAAGLPPTVVAREATEEGVMEALIDERRRTKAEQQHAHNFPLSSSNKEIQT